jgi:hypothetical protein
MVANDRVECRLSTRVTVEAEDRDVDREGRSNEVGCFSGESLAEGSNSS